jgi:hypothetical protein
VPVHPPPYPVRAKRHASGTVALTGLPPLLADIIESALATDPAVQAVSVIDNHLELLASIASRKVFFVIAGESVASPVVLAELLSSGPQIGIAVVGETGIGRFFELWPRVTVVDDLSSIGLRNAIRRTTPWPDRFAAPARAGSAEA